MSHLASSLRVVAHMIDPFMMETSKAVLSQLGLPQATSLENLAIDQLPSGLTVVEKGTPIFPRLDMEEEIAYIKGQMEGNKSAVEKNGIQKKSSSNLTARKSSLTTLIRWKSVSQKSKRFLKLKVLISFSSSAWMQETVKTAKSSLALLNTIQTSKN